MQEKKPEPAPAPAPKVAEKPKAKPEAKKAKPKLLNIEEKIELQGMPFGKAELDQFLDSLRKATKARSPVTFGAVVVTGHTDRIGSLQYNQKLSERRAVVVKDALVAPASTKS